MYAKFCHKTNIVNIESNYFGEGIGVHTLIIPSASPVAT